MTHDYHERLPGYSPEQVLHDGCRECEARSESRDHGMASMDRETFARAWRRAHEWNTTGLADMAAVEVPALSVLWTVQLQLERRGVTMIEVAS